LAPWKDKDFFNLVYIMKVKDLKKQLKYMNDNDEIEINYDRIQLKEWLKGTINLGLATTKIPISEVVTLDDWDEYFDGDFPVSKEDFIEMLRQLVYDRQLLSDYVDISLK
jgi:hypothetical protein